METDTITIRFLSPREGDGRIAEAPTVAKAKAMELLAKGYQFWSLQEGNIAALDEIVAPAEMQPGRTYIALTPRCGG